MKNLVTKENFDILVGAVNSLSKKIEKQNIVIPNNNFQLKFPLDISSESIIQSTVFYPISITLPNTDPATAGNYTTFFTADNPKRIAFPSMEKSLLDSLISGGSTERCNLRHSATA